MTFPYSTLGTYTYQNYSYDYTDTVENLMLNNSFNVGSYPDGMFWGGISKYDVPYAYPATATYDFDAQTITISDLYAGIPGVEIPRTQISYCYVPTVQSNTAPFTNGMINWQLNNGITDMTNQKYLTLSNFTTRVRDSLLASKIPLNKIIFCPYVYYFNLADWNAGNTTITRQQTSIEQWETWENNNETSDKILVGFGIGESGWIESNTRVLNAGWQSTVYYRFPDNGMFGTVIQSPMSNGFSYTNFNIYLASSGGDRTKYALARESASHEDYYYGTSYSNKIYIDSNNVYLPFYNGDVTFDISELLTIDTKNTYWRKPYTQGDNYLIGGHSSQEFQWASVTFQGEIYRVYDTLDDLLKYIASFGRAFCGSMPQRYQHEIAGIIDDLIFAPVLDDNKVYHGEYTRGLANATNPFFTFNDSTDTTYEPKEQGDEPESGEDWDGDRILPPVISGIGDLNGFITMYGMKPSQVAALGNYLWAKFTDATFWESISAVLDNTASIDPSVILNYVVSIRAYPFDLSDVAGTTHELPLVYFGRGLIGIPVEASPTSLSLRVLHKCVDNFAGGDLTVPAKYGDFRDMEPCAKLLLHVPFCGSCEINPSQVVGKHLFLRYTIDFATGGMMAICYTSDSAGEMAYPVAELHGHVGASVQLTGSNELDALQSLAGVGSGIASLMMGNPAGLLSGVVGAASSLASNRAVPHSTGKASGFSAYFQPRVPYIEIVYDQYYKPSNYAHTHGNACQVVQTIGSLHGYTVCKNVDTSGLTCEGDERIVIKRIMESGFYVD